VDPNGETVSDSLPEIKASSYKMTQKIYARQVTVIVSATVNARKTEARWSFNIGS
jgi:hypothetical protein